MSNGIGMAAAANPSAADASRLKKAIIFSNETGADLAVVRRVLRETLANLTNEGNLLEAPVSGDKSTPQPVTGLIDDLESVARGNQALVSDISVLASQINALTAR